MNKKPRLLLIIAILLAFMTVTLSYKKSDAETRGERKKHKEGQTPIQVSFEIKNCGICHRAYLKSMQDDKMLGSTHAEVTEDCFSCHEEPDIRKNHDKITHKPGKLFRQRKYSNDLCVRCHDGYDKLAETTKGSTAFTTAYGDAINPHNTHVGKVECFNCHKIHKDKPPIEYCYGCHHTRQLKNCNDCHGPHDKESGADNKNNTIH
jgi:hypothetical protein